LSNIFTEKNDNEGGGRIRTRFYLAASHDSPHELKVGEGVGAALRERAAALALLKGATSPDECAKSGAIPFILAFFARQV
jgi:hypothetical protein